MFPCKTELCATWTYSIWVRCGWEPMHWSPLAVFLFPRLTVKLTVDKQKIYSHTPYFVVSINIKIRPIFFKWFLFKTLKGWSSMFLQGSTEWSPWRPSGPNLRSVHLVLGTACAMDGRQSRLPGPGRDRGTCHVRGVRCTQGHVLLGDCQRRDDCHVLWLEGEWKF